MQYITHPNTRPLLPSPPARFASAASVPTLAPVTAFVPTYVPPTLTQRAQELSKQRREEALCSRTLCELLAYDRAANLVYVRRTDGNTAKNCIHAVHLLTGVCDCEDYAAPFGRVNKMRRACLASGINPDTLAPFPVRCKHSYAVGFVLADAHDRGENEQLVLDLLPHDLPRSLWRLCPSKFSRTEGKDCTLSFAANEISACKEEVYHAR